MTTDAVRQLHMNLAGDLDAWMVNRATAALKEADGE